jgi:predicted O-methyltransferase YrrM
VKFPSLFTPAQIGVLADLHERDSRERREGIREESSLKALAPSVAQFLYLLIVQKSARTIVEFGTSHGYSTIHLAAAADKTDGRVYSVDVIPEKTASASDNLEAAGLLHRVTLAACNGSPTVH